MEFGSLFILMIWIVLALWPVWLVVAVIVIARKRRHTVATAVAPVGDQAPTPPVDDAVDRHALELKLHQAIYMAQQSPESAGLIPGLQAAVRLLQMESRVGSAASAAAAPVATPTLTPPALQPAPARIDNTVALLYLGALLFVSAVALFVLLAEISGGAKTLLVLVTAGLLYGGGLLTARYARKLAPVAVTFAGIGIGSVPFVGLAAHTYLGVSDRLLWLVLSVAAFVMALVALRRLGAQLMGYLLSLTWLSFATSTLYAVGAPTYMLMWAALGGVIVLQAYLYWRGRSETTLVLQPALRVSYVLIPSALLVSLSRLDASDFAWWHFGVTLALAAAAYVVLARPAVEPTRSSLLALAHLLMVAAVGVVVYDLGSGRWAEVGIGLAIYGLLDAMAILSPWYSRVAQVVPDYARFARYLTACMPLLVTVFWYERWEAVVAGLVLTIVVNGALLSRQRDELLVTPIMLALLFLPISLGLYQREPIWHPLLLGGLYLVLAAGSGGVRYLLRADHEFAGAWRVCYILLLATGLGVVLVHGTALDTALYAGIITAIAAGVGYVERAPRAIVVAPFVAVLAIERFLVAQQWQTEPYAARLALALVGAMAYIVSYLCDATRDELRRRSLAYSAIVLGLLAWLLSLMFDQAVLGVYFGPSVLFATSLILYGEAVRNHLGLSARLLAIAGVVLALQLVLHASALAVNWLIYTHMWAAYAGYVSWLLERRGQTSDARTMEYIALAALSLPIAARALVSPESYGLLMIAEHSALAVAGAALKRSLWVKWSVVAIILALVFLMRDQTYLNLGIIALLLIGYAVYRLQRSEGQ